jgi:3-methyl-2-oxobutanoate hydroxymethyltransferase
MGKDIDVTAYDYSLARLVDQAGTDVILVGDSAANVMSGFETTLPITLDQMIYHGHRWCVQSGGALVVIDMPLVLTRETPGLPSTQP